MEISIDENGLKKKIRVQINYKPFEATNQLPITATENLSNPRWKSWLMMNEIMFQYTIYQPMFQIYDL